MGKKRRIDNFMTKIVGVTYENDDGASRQALLSECQEGDKLLIVRQPDNPHDKNAVAVIHESTGQQLGFLSRDIARDVAKAIKKGVTYRGGIKNLTGGGLLFDRTRGANIFVEGYETSA